jgi:hypothetical protein
MTFDSFLGGVLASLIAAEIVAAVVRLWRRSQGRFSPTEEHRVSAATTPPTTPAPRRLRALDAEGYPADLHVYDELPSKSHVLLPYPTPMIAAHELVQIPAPRSRERYPRDRFIGRSVRWTGIVSNASEEDSVYRVTTHSAYVRVWGTRHSNVPLTRRPEVEILREGQEINYEGQIRRAGEIGFSLVRVEILNTP